MAAGKYDFTIEQGATFSRQITWQNEDGTAVNLTGYTVAGKIKRKVTDAQPLISFTCTVTNAASGIFTFSLTAAQTATLPINPSQKADRELLYCSYDIEATTGGTVYRILEGVAKISPEVTR